MLNVIETFSGIGSQAKALKNIKAKYDIVATVEWDLNAVYAYDIIHNGRQDLSKYMHINKEQLIDKLMNFTISNNGKTPIGDNTLKLMSADALRRFYAAIERTKNHVSITDVQANNLPDKVDVLTYSFPCQDLSICGSWHGNMSGIDRNAHNRSGMLWEVERILKEYVKVGKKLPTFLLMENVSNILSETHRHNFDEWKSYLESIGYTNKVYTLNAINFGIPQKRIRTYMLSIHTKDIVQKELIDHYLEENDLEIMEPKILQPLEKFLRTDYTIEKYKYEAEISNPNFTPSRKKIYMENDIIFDGINTKIDAVNTITTKQDRNPNSGLVIYTGNNEQKSPYRNLTPRECFLLMGFEEADFQALLDNDFEIKRGKNFFTREKLIKMAGNSIVVDVLEVLFEQIIYIKDYILQNNDKYEAC
jgi:DNA (cytosine-5)-methyltransferase 1